MAKEKLIPQNEAIPSPGAYAASNQAYLDGGDQWVDESILSLHKHHSGLGNQILHLAEISDKESISPAKAIILATSLVLDALKRDATGTQLDNKYKIKKTKI